MSEPGRTLGRILRSARREHGYTLAVVSAKSRELARESDRYTYLSDRQLRLLELDKVNPRVSVVRTLVHILKLRRRLTLADLIGTTSED